MLLSDALEQAACQKNIHGGNCHVADEQHLTFFDFACCGRAFDLATFRWSAKFRGTNDTNWTAFLNGYTSLRRIRDADREAVPLFVVIRHIWLLGLHASNGDNRGYRWLDHNYFDRALNFLRK